MPAFVGPIIIRTSSGAISVGDAFSLSPKSSDKTSFGAGGANTGNCIVSTNEKNVTNLFDFDVIDQTKFFNG
ncbi:MULTISPECIES: spore germination protein [Bacillaceae]|uniref:spore germination protein n=1 Tax=Bacillaceae TaxID=186817 RepID=UPI000C787B8F|nr:MULTISPECIES: spore germination protein [Bacillaceae]PLR67043.1 hypothetical protein CYJ36_13730 [Bacillus sp. UMB0893]QNG60632.1 spore germination protein [Bacillus sp. PAMC26568]